MHIPCTLHARDFGGQRAPESASEEGVDGAAAGALGEPAEVAGVENVAGSRDERGLGEAGEPRAEADAGGARRGQVGAAGRGERADGQDVDRDRDGGADRADRGEIRQERRIDAIGAGGGEGAQAGQRLGEVVAAGEDAVGAGDQHEVARQGAGGGRRGADALDGDGARVGGGAGQGGVLDGGAGEPRLGGEADGLGDAVRGLGIAALEVAADRQRRCGDEVGGVGQRLVAADVGAVGQAEGEGEAGGGRADRLRPEGREHAGGAGVPGVGEDEGIAGAVQGAEGGAGIVGHARSPSGWIT